MNNIAQQLMALLDASPVNFLAAGYVEEQLRAAGLRVQFYGEQKKFKQKMSYADKIGAPYAVLLGEDEIAAGKCSVKDMVTGQQVTVTPEEAAAFVLEGLAANNGPIILEK